MDVGKAMTNVACIGECMVELRQAQGGQPAGQGGGLYSRGFGGDTLNTAVYLARLETRVDYLTALGDDALSEEMIAAWHAEGVGTRRVLRLPGKLPGLYMIQTDGKGERQFFHWRENSAARRLMDVPETDEILNSLMSYDIVYFSAITLSLYDVHGRDRLLAAVKRSRLLGTRFVFDTNFRARAWPDRDVARRAFAAAFEAADIVLSSRSIPEKARTS
jgi:2-dehydro-3-deoxygluconokinase